jgi:Domain of unknown function (DUF4386)
VTLRTNARLAGFTYLLYIAVAFPGMVLFDRATSGKGIAAKLAGIAGHASDVRLVVGFFLLSCFAALVLAVTLYAITRDVDRDLAMLGLTCRVGEGVLTGTYLLATLGLLWLATAIGADAPDTAAAHALAAFLLKVQGWNMTIGATFFAVGSTFFSCLLLRGRLVPVPLAWLGVVASILDVIALPAPLVGLRLVSGPAEWFIWLPMLVFEVTLGLWLIVKGVAAPRNRQVAA